VTITDWPTNEALNRLIESSLIYRDIKGDKAYCAFLLQELTREIALGKIDERKRALVVAAETRAAAEADAKRADLLQVAIEALAFYADSDNYDRRGAKPSPISADKGDVARNALEAIDAASAEPKPEGEAR